MQTEFEFTLPRGYVDKNGGEHRHGVMRLATAADELMPQRDPRIQENPAYLTIIVLARVVVSLGSLERVDTKVIEKLFTCDLAFLQQLYQSINDVEQPQMQVVCPHCNESYRVPINFTQGE